MEFTYNEAGTHILMKNPETGGVWAAPPDAIPYLELRGWEPTTAEENILAGLVDDQFDPSETSAKAVSEHLASASPEEVNRVLELERAGKNRKSVVVPDGYEPITGG